MCHTMYLGATPTVMRNIDVFPDFKKARNELAYRELSHHRMSGKHHFKEIPSSKGGIIRTT